MSGAGRPDPPLIRVAAAVVERHGRFLVTRRHEGTHLGGCWEFPGGKCEAGEPPAACLAREMREELDAAIRIRDCLMIVRHDYDDRSVELHFYRCELLSEPRPVLGQALQWAGRDELRTLPFPPADEALIGELTGEDR